MKKLMIAFVLLLTVFSSFAQRRHGDRRQQKIKTALTKYNDNIDNRMKGPKGEVIYIGQNGGRYYVKNGKRIYVEYKGNKK
jgi:outer membrane lipoprotein-sorting protein